MAFLKFFPPFLLYKIISCVPFIFTAIILFGRTVSFYKNQSEVHVMRFEWYCVHRENIVYVNVLILSSCKAFGILFWRWWILYVWWRFAIKEQIVQSSYPVIFIWDFFGLFFFSTARKTRTKDVDILRKDVFLDINLIQNPNN